MYINGTSKLYKCQQVPREMCKMLFEDHFVGLWILLLKEAHNTNL